MNFKKIYSSQIRKSHPYSDKSHATDYYYTRLANLLLDDFRRSDFALKETQPMILVHAATTLACYMEDIVADSGQWRTFSNLCQEMFGWPVPIYHDDTEDYYPDEPNMMAIRYLIWLSATEEDTVWWKPFEKELDKLSAIAFRRLCDEFEKAPINEQLTNDIDKMLSRAEEDFDSMRYALMWILTNGYLTHTSATKELLEKQTEKSELMKDMDPDKQKYHAMVTTLFDNKVGPLALYPKEYLAALAKTKSRSQLAEDLGNIEVFPLSFFQYALSKDKKTIHLKCTNGKDINIAREEITLNNKRLSENNGCVASFVYYQEGWHLNGAMIVIPDITKRWEDLCKEDPSYVKEGKTMADADWYLERTGGKQLLFFADVEETKKYIGEKFGFVDKNNSMFGSHPQYQPAMMFISTKEERNALCFSWGFCNCIKAPDNPFYDAESAKREAIEILWNPEGIGTEAVIYMLEKDYLPDLLSNPFFNQKASKETRKKDALFFMRYMRQYQF